MKPRRGARHPAGHRVRCNRPLRGLPRPAPAPGRHDRSRACRRWSARVDRKSGGGILLLRTIPKSQRKRGHGAGATGVRLGHRPQHSDRVHLGCDNAPRNIFSLTGFVLKILKFIAHSPTRAIEHLQDNKNRAIRLLSGFHCIALIGLWLSLASTEIEIINFEP